MIEPTGMDPPHEAGDDDRQCGASALYAFTSLAM